VASVFPVGSTYAHARFIFHPIELLVGFSYPAFSETTIQNKRDGEINDRPDFTLSRLSGEEINMGTKTRRIAAMLKPRAKTHIIHSQCS
jgi:hypothetical protein